MKAQFETFGNGEYFNRDHIVKFKGVGDASTLLFLSNGEKATVAMSALNVSSRLNDFESKKDAVRQV